MAKWQIRLLLGVLIFELLLGGLIGYFLACYTNPDYCSLLWVEGFLLGVTSWGIWFVSYTLIACGIWYLVVRHRQGKAVSPSA